MPIEFSCPQCSRVLRVSDEHAGKAARCPDCSMVMHVPGGQPQAPPPAQGQQTGNQFGGAESRMPSQSPMGSHGMPGAKIPGHDPWASQRSAVPNKQARPVRPTAASFEDISGYAWRATSANWGLLIGVTVLVLGIQFMFGVVQGIVDEIANPGAEGSIPGLFVALIGNAVSIFMGIGQMRINFDIARKGQANFATLFSGGDKFLPVLGASIVAGIMMMLGFICLIVPGLILVVLFWPYYTLIVDDKETAMGSFTTAMAIGKLNVGTTIVMILISFLVMVGGALALLVGLLIALPYVSMLWSVAYLKMAGQL